LKLVVYTYSSVFILIACSRSITYKLNPQYSYLSSYYSQRFYGVALDSASHFLLLEIMYQNTANSRRTPCRKIPMIKVILVDDHAIIRDGVKAMLRGEESIQIVGEAGHGQELLDLLEKGETDANVVLLDINMPVMDGFEAAGQLKAHYPDLKVFALSMLDHEKYILRMMEAGSLGYGLKNMSKLELVHGLKMVAGGNRFICSEIAYALISRAGSVAESPLENNQKQPGDLSKREIEVLRLIADGLTAAQIADKLFTSKRTIESHRQNLLEKTQSKNTAALVRYAASVGLID
jgi:DNA-binding NarL/FixJ family response regulator